MMSLKHITKSLDVLQPIISNTLNLKDIIIYSWNFPDMADTETMYRDFNKLYSMTGYLSSDGDCLALTPCYDMPYVYRYPFTPYNYII